MPALICKACEIELYQCTNFRRKIQTSQEYFNSQLQDFEYNLWNCSSEHVEELNEEYSVNEDVKIESLVNVYVYEHATDEYQLEEALEKNNETVEVLEIIKSSPKRKGRKVQLENPSFKR